MSKYDIIVGIDPGKSGGIVATNEFGDVIFIGKTPETIEGHISIFSSLGGKKNKKIVAIVEKVTGRFGDSAHSAFSFGHSVGIVHTCLTYSGIQYDLVHPKTWQKYYGVSRGRETSVQWKNRLKALAQELHPKEKVTLWSADAILLANYGHNVLNK